MSTTFILSTYAGNLPFATTKSIYCHPYVAHNYCNCENPISLYLIKLSSNTNHWPSAKTYKVLKFCSMLKQKCKVQDTTIDKNKVFGIQVTTQVVVVLLMY